MFVLLIAILTILSGVQMGSNLGPDDSFEKRMQVRNMILLGVFLLPVGFYFIAFV